LRGAGILLEAVALGGYDDPSMWHMADEASEASAMTATDSRTSPMTSRRVTGGWRPVRESEAPKAKPRLNP